MHGPDLTFKVKEELSNYLNRLSLYKLIWVSIIFPGYFSQIGMSFIPFSHLIKMNPANLH